MISKVFLLLFLISAAWSLPRTDGGDAQLLGSRIDDMDVISANISAIWSEINRLSELVNTHVQNGHHHHSHKGHDDHHNHHKCQHCNETEVINDQIGEESNHTQEMGHHHHDNEHVGHHHHDNEHVGHHHQDDEHAGHHHHVDEHVGHHHHDGKQGGHSHDDDSHEVHSSNIHKSHNHDDDDSNEVESKGNDPYTSKGNDHHQYHYRHPPQSHGHHGKHSTKSHHHGGSTYKTRDHSDESDSDENYSSKLGEVTPKMGGIGTQKLDLNRPSHENGLIMIGYCAMKPNIDIPESRIEGNVAVLQKKYGKGPIYYKLNLHGFSVGEDVSSRSHGFHIHEKALLRDGACNSAGAHFNPSNQSHGSPSSTIRHLGDFGNIIVGRDGTIVEYTLTDVWNNIGNIFGKSFIVHELPDDLGKGGNTGSLATGNAGRRLACCNILSGTDESIRFNG